MLKGRILALLKEWGAIVQSMSYRFREPTAVMEVSLTGVKGATRDFSHITEGRAAIVIKQRSHLSQKVPEAPVAPGESVTTIVDGRGDALV